MPRANFDTPDGEDVDIDADDVISLSKGEEDGTTVIELEDGSEVLVVAAQIEVVAELGLNPLDFLDPEEDDQSVVELVDEERDGEA